MHQPVPLTPTLEKKERRRQAARIPLPGRAPGLSPASSSQLQRVLVFFLSGQSSTEPFPPSSTSSVLAEHTHARSNSGDVASCRLHRRGSVAAPVAALSPFLSPPPSRLCRAQGCPRCCCTHAAHDAVASPRDIELWMPPAETRRVKTESIRLYMRVPVEKMPVEKMTISAHNF